jgi:hypothetical protein
MVYFCLFVFIENFILECYCSVDKKSRNILFCSVIYQGTTNVTMGFPPEIYLNKEIFLMV